MLFTVSKYYALELIFNFSTFNSSVTLVQNIYSKQSEYVNLMAACDGGQL